jgi:multimeric flavodoxin WrbA
VKKELENSQNEVKYFDVYESHIGGCKACLGCQKDTATINCVVQDEMQPILNAVAQSDVLIFAAPIYIWSAPAPVKAVIDRLVYASCKYYGDNPKGPSLLENKKLAIITTCGYPVEKGADLYQEEMKRFCKHAKMIYAGMLCERQKNLKEPFMDSEKEEHAKNFATMLQK